MSTLLRRIRAKQRGWVFTPKDFLDIGARNAIDQVLYRLVNKKIIRKLDRGIYDFPIIHQKLGALAPDPDKIARALAAQTGDVLQPSGARAANWWGLNEQVPSQPVYMTTGRTMRKCIFNRVITFKHSKYISHDAAQNKVALLIHTWQYLGRAQLTKNVIDKCAQHFSKKDKTQLKAMLPKIPAWMVPALKDLIGKTK